MPMAALLLKDLVMPDFRARVHRGETFLIAGDRFASLELNVLVQQVIVVDDRRRAAEELARRWSQLTPEDILESPFVLIGTIDQMIEDNNKSRVHLGVHWNFDCEFGSRSGARIAEAAYRNAYRSYR